MRIISKITVVSLVMCATNIALASDEATVTVENEAASTTTALPPAYPKWPQQQFQRNTMPPPPPGPYMSTALSTTQNGFHCCDENIEKNREQVPSPYLQNSDWPKRAHQPPQKWMPTNGEYHYVPENELNQRDAMPMDAYNYPSPPPWMPMRYPSQYGYR